MVALFVIGFVILMLSIDLVIQARAKRYPIMASVPHMAHEASAGVRVPKGIFFHPGHTWARLSERDTVVVGMDDFLQKALGGVSQVSIPVNGAHVRQGEPVITVERDGRRLSLVSPVSGMVQSVNREAIENPSVLRESPYEEGWLFMVEPEELASNMSALRIAENATQWFREEIIRFREFLNRAVSTSPVLGEAMLDGGLPVTGSLTALDDTQLRSFEESFLR
jgi:glycine cleavage system H lipoate-binding protein